MRSERCLYSCKRIFVSETHLQRVFNRLLQILRLTIIKSMSPGRFAEA